MSRAAHGQRASSSAPPRRLSLQAPIPTGTDSVEASYPGQFWRLVVGAATIRLRSIISR
jgi:hypothetical protein